MAADLVEGLWEAADASDALTAAFGRKGWLWRDEAPRGEPMPYAVLTVTGGDPTWESEDDGHNRPYANASALQLDVFAATRERARALAATALALWMTSGSIAFDDGHLCGLYGDDAHDLKDPERGPDGGDVWRRVVLIRALTGHVLSPPS
jgi:hypothetical protein